MTTASRVRCTWTGVQGLPGVTTFIVGGTLTSVAAFNTFFTAIKSYLAVGVTIATPSTGDLFDPATGTLTGSWSGTGASSIVSAGAGVFPAGTGARVNWTTGDIVAGRRVQGRTFLAPLSSGVYQTDGTLLATAQAALQSAAQALVADLGVGGADPGLSIWSRPATGRAGTLHQVQFGLVPDQVSSLRSRRI